MTETNGGSGGRPKVAGANFESAPVLVTGVWLAGGVLAGGLALGFLAFGDSDEVHATTGVGVEAPADPAEDPSAGGESDPTGDPGAAGGWDTEEGTKPKSPDEEDGEDSDSVDTVEPEPEDYTIVWGDTLSELAEEHDVPMDVLVELNDIENPDLIYAGASLLIPPPQ